MLTRKMRWVLCLTLVVFVGSLMIAGCGSSSSTSKKATYPDRSIELVVPFAAGGGSDIMARMLVKAITDNKLSTQPFAINNKPGGSGAIGYAYVAEKKGDPYYIASVSSSFYTGPLMGKSPVSYKDFTPVCGLAMDTLLLVVREDSKYKSVKDIIDDAKARPKGISVGGTSGTSDDAVMFSAMQVRTGTEMKYVPYNSGGEVMTSLLGGHVDIVWTNPGEALGHLQSKKVRALAVASKDRLSGLPEVPTLKEQGIDLVLAQFRGIVMPKDAPPEAVAYLEGVFKKVSEASGWKDDYLKKNMVEGRFMNSKDFAQALVDTTKMYEEFLKNMKK